MKYSTIILTLLFFITFLIDDPKSTHTVIEGKQTIKPIKDINKTAIIKFSSLGKKPTAAEDEIVQAFGFTI
tara:strand:- start:5 stop:217 length:213 start_codon:yes stop_codon:yes gene_type:complete